MSPSYKVQSLLVLYVVTLVHDIDALYLRFGSGWSATARFH